ncbi:energy-coupling factor transporter transmembrane component T [Enterococcus crotali]|uniref:energy-coupling factor transporter transmembrane component T n=1 Tax=Enterococcus crotali TaxID=1453587 RepID=UPI00046FC223|nr:energy-coupling factor transporter transmembrane component T [Enterococcus crotali]
MNTRIGRLYPGTKVACVLLIIILCMFLPGYLFQYAVLPFIMLLSLFSHNFWQFISVFMKSIFVVIVFIFVIQVFIVKNEDSTSLWWIFSFSQMGLDNSLGMTSKIVGISSSIIYFFQVTSTKDIHYTLEKSGVPKKMTFVIASTIQLVPQMSNLSKTITDAQKSRGIETEGSLWIRMKSFVPMIGPLVLSSIQQTEERVLTLESRAFSSKNKKTSIYELPKRKIDYLITITCWLIFAGFIIWRLMK